MSKLSSIWSKVGQVIKSQDLFGVPVQLTYKGERAFNTIHGGCFSAIIVLFLLVAFFTQLYDLYYFPQFYNRPPTYDYRKETALLYPSVGNTVAIYPNQFGQYYSDYTVVFNGYDEDTDTKTALEAVFCSDLYKHEIS